MSTPSEMRTTSAVIDAELDQMVCAGKEILIVAAAIGDRDMFLRLVDRVLDEYKDAHAAARSDPANIERFLHAMIARLGLKRFADSLHQEIDPELVITKDTP